MSSDERPRKTRRVISATCAIHPGAQNFTNLELIWDGDLTLRPHATGACTLILNEAEVAELYAFIEEQLG